MSPTILSELKQGVAVLSASKHKPAAAAFLDYIFSAEGAAVLKDMVSAYRQANDRSGTHAYAAVGHHGVGDPASHRRSAGILACLFALAREVPGGSDGRAADRGSSRPYWDFMFWLRWAFSPLGRWYQSLTGHTLPLPLTGW